MIYGRYEESIAEYLEQKVAPALVDAFASITAWIEAVS